MRLYLVIAQNRSDWSEKVVALSPRLDEARHCLAHAAGELLGPGSAVLRCRIVARDMTLAKVQIIVHGWGRADAQAGGMTLAVARAEATRRFPSRWAKAYLRGFRDGKNRTQ